MRRGKLWLVLIPLILIILILVGGFVYLKLNSTPKKIFTTTITKIMDVIKEKQKDYTTTKTKIELSANIESDEEDVKEINDVLETSRITLESEIDTKKLLVNGNIEVIYDNENLINAELLLQDQKVYVAVKDWFDKYIEIPQENYDFSEIEKYFNNANSIDKTLLLETVKQELVNELSNQTYTKEKVTMDLNGQATKVTKSSLKLNKEQTVKLTKELLTNLKNNSNFQKALGIYKDNILNNINEVIDNMSDENADEDSVITISIYTKGLLNKFVAVDLTTSDSTEELGGIAFVKTSQTKYEFYAYSNYEGTREYIIRVLGEEYNGQGTITILVPNDEQELELVCKYKRKNNQTSYEITTEIGETKVSISGSVIKEGTKYSGNAIFVFEASEVGKINLSCLYSLEYNAEIQRVDVENSTALDEMTEEEQQELLTNVENSKLYELLMNGVLGNDMNMSQEALEASSEVEADLSNTIQGLDNKEVSLDNKTVKYNVPEQLKPSSYNSNNLKIYSDENFNTVNISIEKENAEEYLENISNNYILTSSNYINQNITGVSEYSVNEKQFNYRGITYSDSFGDYLELYFVYKITEGYIYVVDATIEGNSLSLDDLNYFLDITVE